MIAAVALLVTHWDKVVDVLKTVWDWFKRILSFTPIGLIGQAISAGGDLLGFQDGGIVPGAIGAPQLAVVHGGELVTPAPQVSRITQDTKRSQTVIDNSTRINSLVINSSADNADALFEDIEKMIGRNNRFAALAKVDEVDT